MTTKKVKRRLSIPRLLLVLIILGLITGGYLYKDNLVSDAIVKPNKISKPWFASYVDATLTPTYAFEKREDNIVLSFVVAKNDQQNEASWGNAYTLKEAAEDLDLERRIARLRQKGGEVIVSFGGLLNNELAVAIKDEAKLYDAYQSVVSRYELSTIDLDLEQAGLTDKEANKRRAKVLAKLQKDQAKVKTPLAIWVTLPVTPQGLTEEGTNAVTYLLDAGVDLAGVNVMTMNYGGSRNEKLSMADNSINALKKTHRQLKIIYQEQDVRLSDAALWQKLGATPMIGQNDVADEVFTLKDARKLNEFAKESGLARLSMWSANRDNKSNENSVSNQVVSNHTSGVAQDSDAFADLLKDGLNGSIAEEAKHVTVSDISKADASKPDDPAASPYDIWSDNKAYLTGAKVVWKRNVYRAKWWTKGDMPDAPVLQETSIPWELVGPVMPGEKPIEKVTLPKNAYSNWSKEDEYAAGDRVMYEGNPYEAKWWNQGDNPEKAIANEEGSPWRPLSQEDIKKVLREEK